MQEFFPSPIAPSPLWDLTAPQKMTWGVFSGNYFGVRHIPPLSFSRFDELQGLNGFTCFFPYFLNSPMTLDKVTAYLDHTTGTPGANTVQFALYNSDPVTKLASTQIANSAWSIPLGTTGATLVNTYSPQPVLPAGLLWGAICPTAVSGFDAFFPCANLEGAGAIYQSLFGMVDYSDSAGRYLGGGNFNLSTLTALKSSYVQADWVANGGPSPTSENGLKGQAPLFVLGGTT